MWTTRLTAVAVGAIPMALGTIPASSNAATIEVPTDYPTIQAAMDAATDGDTVRVLPGTYTENIDFGGKAIILESASGPEVTIIDGSGADAVVTFDDSETETSVIRGFTIQNGWHVSGGGGIRCVVASPTIEDNVIVRNRSRTGGGIYGLVSSPTIRRNVIDSNTADGYNNGGGGIGLTQNSPALVEDNVISNNTVTNFYAFGGGLLCKEGSNATARGNTIRGNRVLHDGGAGIGSWNSAVEIVGNFIHNNSGVGGGGGVSILGGESSVRENIIVRNQARLGAGLKVTDSPGIIEGNTFVENESTYLPLGSTIASISPTTSPVTARNIVVRSVGGYGIDCGVNHQVTCNLLFDNDLGPFRDCEGQGLFGNFEADPRFCDAASDDFTLAADSPGLPGNHPEGIECGLIGALTEGCPAVPVKQISWGRIKARFAQ